MSYQTGTATSPVNLLQTIVTWLVSIGWTQDSSAADGAGWRAHLHKSGNYVNLRASMNDASWAAGLANPATGYGLHLYLGTGYTSANAWNAQPGGPVATGTSNAVGVGMNLPSGAIQNYYFFGDATGDNVVIVVEKTPALYQHFAWGLSLVKAGTWTGGAYFSGSIGNYNALSTATAGPGGTLTCACPGADADDGAASNFFVRCDVDTFTGKWLGVSQNNQTLAGYTGKFAGSSVLPVGVNYTPRNTFPPYSQNMGTGGTPSTWQANQTSNVDGRANLLPVLLWVNRDSGAWSFIGTIPNVFCSNGVGNGFSNASEYLLGTTTYKMFPNFAVIKQ